MSDNTIHVVFDGPPGPESGRFVEVEDATGRSISAGEWHERDDGLWELILPGHPVPDRAEKMREALDGIERCATYHENTPTGEDGQCTGCVVKMAQMARAALKEIGE